MTLLILAGVGIVVVGGIMYSIRPEPPTTEVRQHPSSRIVPKPGPYDWSKNADFERDLAKWKEDQ